MTRARDPLNIADGGGTLPPPERYQKIVKDFLRIGGVNRQHPEYAFFHALLTNVCKASHTQSRVVRSFGKRLAELAGDETPTTEAMASIREIAKRLDSYFVDPDFDALRGILIAMRGYAKRHKSNSNLRVSRSPVTDKEICEAVKQYVTKARAAKRVGLTERQLFRRLKKMKPKVTSRPGVMT